jgi:hypothetical protein
MTPEMFLAAFDLFSNERGATQVQINGRPYIGPSQEKQAAAARFMRELKAAARRHRVSFPALRYAFAEGATDRINGKPARENTINSQQSAVIDAAYKSGYLGHRKRSAT